MSKQPYMAFFVGDWKRDSCVNACSPATRGIWFDFLCDMFDGGSVGMLTGTADYFCRVGRCSRGELDNAISELTKTRTADVSTRGDQITVVNRRMRKATELASKRADSGSKGISKRLANAEDDIEAEIAGVEWMKTPEFTELIESFEGHRIQIRKPLTPIAKLQQIRQLKAWGKDRAFEAVRYSIAQGWQGVFEPKSYTPLNNGNGNGTKPMSAWEIETKLKAVQGELNRTEMRTDQAGVKEHRAKLFAERNRLRALQTGVSA